MKFILIAQDHINLDNVTYVHFFTEENKVKFHFVGGDESYKYDLSPAEKRYLLRMIGEPKESIP